MIFSSGPSPLVPLLLVGALSWMIYGEAMTEWYEYATELQESVAETSPVLILLAAAVGLLLFNFMSQLIVLPLAVAAAVFMLQNTLITALVLLGVIHFVGVYYYYYNTPQKSAPYLHWDRERTPSSIIGGESGGGGGFGLGFYMLVLLCLILCSLFCESGVWLPFVCVVAFVIFFHMFSYF